MDIDMAALRALEHEKDISFDVVVEAIETALLSAYHKSHGAHAQARVELDRKTGHVTVWARERLDTEPAEESEAPAPGSDADTEPPEPRYSEEFDDTPEDFGRDGPGIPDDELSRMLCALRSITRQEKTIEHEGIQHFPDL